MDYASECVNLRYNRQMQVRVYSTLTCPYCIMEKEYLKEKGIDFINIMVDNDNEKSQELYNLSGQLGVPFTIIENPDSTEVKILGFDKTKLDTALGIKD